VTSSRGVLVLTAAFFVFGCSTADQPHSFTGGYTDQKIDDSTEEVSFRGNGFTAPEKVHTYLLRRCAEVTTQNGFDYFVVVDQQQPNEGDSNLYGAKVNNKYRSVATIKMFKGSKPENEMNAYSAEQVIRNTAGLAAD
jgi:hypothetical protein